MRAPWLVLLLVQILPPLSLLREALCHRNDSDLSASTTVTTGQRSRETSSRRRRELAFPKGSAFVVTLTLLKSIQITEPSDWNLDMEFDMIWPIPSREDLRRTVLGRPVKLKRRHRRELYANFESALDSRNLPGRTCILRAICEVKTVLSPPGFSLIEDAIRVVLRYDNESSSTKIIVTTNENALILDNNWTGNRIHFYQGCNDMLPFVNLEDADECDCYDVAYRTRADCEVAYPCPFSLLRLLLYNLYTQEP
ncbi:PREDICTED: uncharacterized protein LOC106742166 [Dinoponera quadriceps]|uniref:Uncharacterized protein LOC106742166 n=1 Tax=Dinoponera quadriceps TaxID=609295 RepID=A0A6P3WW74_DINQU|nr:PREDICTED: uncharacterized protein LOC106742166 [Dinoponera quadriceps]